MQRLIRLQQGLYLFFLEILIRLQKKHAPIPFNDALKSASRVLVCAPREIKSGDGISQMVAKLQKVFPLWKLTMVVQSDQLLDADTKKYRRVVLNENNVNQMGKVKRRIADELGAFDIGIDLSIPFDFTNTLLLWNCNIKVRIGFYHPKREKLYNLVVRQKNESTLEHTYPILLNFLQSF